MITAMQAERRFISREGMARQSSLSQADRRSTTDSAAPRSRHDEGAEQNDEARAICERRSQPIQPHGAQLAPPEWTAV